MIKYGAISDIELLIYLKDNIINIINDLNIDILKQAILHANPWLQHKDIQININCADTSIKILGDTVRDVASYNSILTKHK